MANVSRDPASCPLCTSEVEGGPRARGESLEYACSCCGSFSITATAYDMLGAESDRRRRILAYWTCDQNAIGLPPRITGDIVEGAMTLAPPSVERRTHAYLGAVVRAMKGQLHGQFSHTEPSFQIASWSTPDDAAALGNYWLQKGALLNAHYQGMFNCGVETRIAFDEVTGNRVASSQAFVAMSFADELRAAYDLGIAPAIKESGYSPLRVDRTEHEGKIDDLIVAEIRRSGFTVVDLTHHRAGVYYEAGFAHGLGQRVIFTCQKAGIADTHFDIRQYNTLLWNEPAELKSMLQNRILALFGAGPSNPNAKPVAV